MLEISSSDALVSSSDAACSLELEAMAPLVCETSWGGLHHVGGGGGAQFGDDGGKGAGMLRATSTGNADEHEGGGGTHHEEGRDERRESGFGRRLGALGLGLDGIADLRAITSSILWKEFSSFSGLLWAAARSVRASLMHRATILEILIEGARHRGKAGGHVLADVELAVAIDLFADVGRSAPR